MEVVWDEKKRHSNLAKHGLDFMDADLVLESNYRRAKSTEREVYHEWLENEKNNH